MADKAPTFPGFPGGADFSEITKILEDPSIKAMAEEFARNPAFQQITQQMQQSVTVGSDGKPAVDPEKYMETMKGLMQEPSFNQMAQELSQAFIKDSPFASMMQNMQQPQFQQEMKKKVEDLKSDPEMKNIIEEMETGGQAAMMKYWNNPEVLKKFSKVFSEGIQFPGAQGQASVEEETEEYEEEGDDEPKTIHEAAGVEDSKVLVEFMGKGDKDEKDSEGRVPLHFACGHGIYENVHLLIEGGAKIDTQDNNNNTPLHYAAGYGRSDIVEFLLKKGADTTITNKDGKTAQEVAALNQKEDVLEAFKKLKI